MQKVNKWCEPQCLELKIRIFVASFAPSLQVFLSRCLLANKNLSMIHRLEPPRIFRTDNLYNFCEYLFVLSQVHRRFRVLFSFFPPKTERYVAKFDTASV